jgi:FkbM family methyltransferase
MNHYNYTDIKYNFKIDGKDNIIDEININYYKNNYKFYVRQEDSSGYFVAEEVIKKDEYLLYKYNNNIGKHIIDIGANFGLVTMILAKQNPESIIYAFEPHYETFKILELNVNINNLTNVKLFNIAVSNNNTDYIKLITHPQLSGGNTTQSDINVMRTHFSDKFKEEYDTVFKHKIKEITVNCISLDKIVSQFNIDNIFLLKIDCEGAEYDIIYDSIFFKTKKIEYLIGEFHNLKYNKVGNNTADKLIEYCKLYINNDINISILNI